MELLKWALYVLGFLWVTWLGYGSMMSLLRAQNENTLTPISKILGYPALAIFILADVVLNVLCSIPFLELPDRWLTTGRLEKYKYHTPWSNQWRGKAAAWL